MNAIPAYVGGNRVDGNGGWRTWGLPRQEAGAPRPPVGSPMSQGEQNCRPAKELVDGTGDIVQAVGRVIERVARKSQNGGNGCNADT